MRFDNFALGDDELMRRRPRRDLVQPPQVQGDVMKVNGVAIDDTFAEAFGMKATGIVITAHSMRWARHAAVSTTGFATSVIGCGCEAGIERELTPEETPDGRPGVRVLLFAMSGKELAKQLERRVGQCVLTCPASACFAGVEPRSASPSAKTCASSATAGRSPR